VVHAGGHGSNVAQGKVIEKNQRSSGGLKYSSRFLLFVFVYILPDKDEVSVNVDGLVHGGKHIRRKQPLCGTNSEHGPHIFSFLEICI
jgi:hypothetical protein